MSKTKFKKTQTPQTNKKKQCICCQQEFELTLAKRLCNPISTIKIHTDGSYYVREKQSIGCGIGVYFGKNSKLNVAAPMHFITNVGPRSITRAELSATLLALRIMSGFPEKIEIITDSEYIIKSIPKLNSWLIRQWRNSNGKKIVNWDLFELIYLCLLKLNVQFTHVNAHKKNIDNDMADYLAKLGANEDIGFEYLKPVSF
ncbi:ribonuclease H-like protein [Neoconidiobolus thromboides FSU 785]|nr:ribonuclease H-like protein [Neoconidiobolus thromboides FSU 785]